MTPGPLSGGASRRPLPDDPELVDAFADRALGRAANAVALGSAALTVMATLFVVLTGGTPGAGSVPQLVILSAGAVVGLTVSAALLHRLRRLRAEVDAGAVGVGPGAAADGAVWLARLVVVAPVVAALAALGVLVSVRPFATAVVSCAVGIAVVSQLAVLGAVQRSSLRRVTTGR